MWFIAWFYFVIFAARQRFHSLLRGFRQAQPTQQGMKSLYVF